MDPGNIPFIALIVGPTNSGKTQFLVNQLSGAFNGKFDYIVLICPTFAYNRTLFQFGERDPRLYVIICEQHHRSVAKRFQFLFRWYQDCHCCSLLRCLKRRRRGDRRACQTRFLGTPRWHQCVGVDTGTLQHREAFPG